MEFKEILTGVSLEEFVKAINDNFKTASDNRFTLTSEAITEALGFKPIGVATYNTKTNELVINELQVKEI